MTFNYSLMPQKAVSDVAGDLDLSSELKKTLQKAKCLKCLLIGTSVFLWTSCIVHLSICYSLDFSFNL